jgi:hypothetical protein
MPITQFFSEGSQMPLASFAITSCASAKPDDINWTDAEMLVNSFKLFSAGMGIANPLSFVLEKTAIEQLFAQDASIGGVKIYLAFCNTDNSIRAIGVAAQLNPNNNEYDDYNIPATLLGTDIATLPFIANTRPCPPQCGTKNVLNQPLL